MEVNVIDAIMGTGKTSAMINYINSTGEDEKILYITPYLTEVKRVIKSCPTKHFQEPESYGTKINGIKILFGKGCNIVSTHALFRLFDQEIIEMAYANNYTLVMDEVADVIEMCDISKFDFNTIMSYCHVGDDCKLVWDVQEYRGEFKKYKRLCDLGCLALYGNTIMMWLFPISTFKAFRKIYILTYLFSAQMQKYYYDYYGVDYRYLYVKGNSLETYAITDEPVDDYIPPDYSKLINICDIPKLNAIGDMNYTLTKGWYDRHSKNELMRKLKNNCINYFRNIVKTKSSENLWTTFADYKDELAAKGYSKGFLASNVRATNLYRNRTSVAYLINKFFNPCIKNFFVGKGITVDEDTFAVSELVQFIWRSAVRDNKSINLYIPSERMRTLLRKWLEQFKK